MIRRPEGWCVRRDSEMSSRTPTTRSTWSAFTGPPQTGLPISERSSKRSNSDSPEIACRPTHLSPHTITHRLWFKKMPPRFTYWTLLWHLAYDAHAADLLFQVVQKSIRWRLRCQWWNGSRAIRRPERAPIKSMD